MRIGNKIALNCPIGPAWPDQLKSNDLRLTYQAKEQFHLHISGNDSLDKKRDVSWEEQIKGSRTDPKLKLMDKHIAKAGKLLEQMKELAKSAQDETLSDEHRLSIQMQMGKLQHELDCETEMFCSAYYTGEAKIGLHEQRYEDTDSYKMLQRAAERLANGEEWNVAEVRTPIFSINQEIERYVWQVTDDPDVPTVDEILKAKGRSVMSPEAAKVSASELEYDITGLLKLRDRFASLVKKNSVRQQGTNAEDSDFSKEAFFSRMMDFLNIIARDPVAYNSTGGEGPITRTLTLEEGSEERKYPEQKSVEDEVLRAAVADCQLRGKLSANINLRFEVA